MTRHQDYRAETLAEMMRDTERDPDVTLMSDDGIVITCVGVPDNPDSPISPGRAGEPHPPKFITQFRRPTFGKNTGEWLASPLSYRTDKSGEWINFFGSRQYELSCKVCPLTVQRAREDVDRWLDAFEAAGKQDVWLYVLAERNRLG